MRISDWSSDVCSSDLLATGAGSHDRHQLFGNGGGLVDPTLQAAFAAPAPWIFGAVEIVLPDYNLRLLDGASELTINGNLYKGEDATFGTLAAIRTEEQTSELQALMRIPYAVFCLKKKKKKEQIYKYTKYL